jgi:hypothetical protein
MPSVTYDFVPGQTVYVIVNNGINSGPVVEVVIKVQDGTPDVTTITYWVNVDSVLTAFTHDVADGAATDIFATCKGAEGYQDVVFTSTLSATGVAISASDPLATGSPTTTLEASVVIDGGSPIALSLTLDGSPPGVTFQDVLDNLNASLGLVGTASLETNNIRITSATKGTSSTVVITDGGTGSPTTPYFASLNTYTGLAASVAGVEEGALEALGDQIC